MPNPFKTIEQFLYWLRDIIWDYPDKLFSDDSLKTRIDKVYKAATPYSHFILALVIFVFVSYFVFTDNYRIVLGAQRQELIEAVVMGTDSQGRLQKINKVNPILPTNIQLEKDLVNLIYEPLINYEYEQNPDGTYDPKVEPILASEVIKIQQGADYQFDLKKGVRWHDGAEFNADDVIATFNLVSKLTKNDNAYIKAIKQMVWEKVDDFTVRICTKTNDQSISCSKNKDVKPIFSNFLELISIKILPAHKIKDISDSTIEDFSADLFRSPIGTGKFKFSSADNQSITLVRNDDYIYPSGVNPPQITAIQFKYYKTLADAVQAIQNGEAHSLVSISVQYKTDLQGTSSVKVNTSPVIDNQYWGLYFNLKTDPNGAPKGPAFFTDSANPVYNDEGKTILNNGIRVREAISSAISRYEIINNALLGVGDEAFGPITQRSNFFNKNAGWFTYDPDKAKKLLDDAGWTIKNGNKVRTDAKGNELRFSLYFVDSFDRFNVARVIQKNLADLGVEVIIDRRQEPGQDSSDSAPSGWSLDELNKEVLAPRSFDVLLYGMNTFIDPDRFELFDSTEQNDPGLNIAGYTGIVSTVKPNDHRTSVNDPSTIELPKVDRDLELARSYDPESNKDDRLKLYFDFQSLVASDAPVVFLYHPQFIYYTNTNLKKIDLTNVASVEDRFRNIENWKLN